MTYYIISIKDYKFEAGHIELLFIRRAQTHTSVDEQYRITMTSIQPDREQHQPFFSPTVARAKRGVTC